MANLTFKAENFSFLSNHTNTQTSLLNTTTSFKTNSIRLLHSKNSLTFRVWCSLKEKENVKESGRVPDVLTGLKRVDELDSKRGSSLDFEQKLGDDIGSGEVGFDWNWPPWKNIPQRYKLIGTTSLAFVICNMDKVNLSVAIIPMSHQFGWNASMAGLVQSSFFWGYALSQLPGGWLAKIFGGRKVLKFGVLTWSVATALLPFLAGYMPGLMLSRVLVGIGEGVSPSAATDLIARSIPLEERSRAVAFVFGGLSVGSVIGLLLAPPLIQNFGWASVFYIFGFLGLAWYLGFQYLEEGQASHAAKPASRPQSIHMEKSSSNYSLAELGGSLKDVPWKAFFQTPAVWAMIYAHFCGSWGHYTCLSWLPSYFSEELSLNLTEAAWVSILPPLASVFDCHPGRLWGFSLVAWPSQALPCQDFTVHIKICLLNMQVYCWALPTLLEQYPGIVGVALTGYLLDTTHSWSISLFAPSIFFYLTGTIVWLAFASSKPQNFSNTD
ncbi:SOLUTE CARRIER FAMILY 17 [Salix purpurea]|uniref:SOLUTE CARRIER FAMILY 17 n=1 Tax=Salix purpurea TaxID=77065 RepID=A0A9Q0Q4H2_SALPP|nr:SOLUTE CARRIER FAMILY 17 [Salix purpurea]